MSDARRARTTTDTTDDASVSSEIPSYDALIATHGVGAFFELANAPAFRYDDLRVRQDQSVVDSCGGIVWESAFCLVNYLRANARFASRPR